MILSRDAAAAIKRFCYNNLREFHGRHVARRGVSYRCFLRVVNGAPATEEIMSRVMSALHDLNLLDPEGLPTYIDSLHVELCQFVKVAESVIKNPNHENLMLLVNEVSTAKQLTKRNQS